MFVGLLRFSFEEDSFQASDFKKEAGQFCQSLRARFHVLAKATTDPEHYIIVCAMAAREHEVNATFHAILNYAEERGMGRIFTEDRLIAAADDLFADDGLVEE